MNLATLLILLALLSAVAAALFALHRQRVSDNRCAGCSLNRFCRKK